MGREAPAGTTSAPPRKGARGASFVVTFREGATIEDIIVLQASRSTSGASGARGFDALACLSPTRCGRRGREAGVQHGVAKAGA